MSLDVASLYEREYPAICRYFRRRLGDDWEMAEDLASEVFARAWAKRDTFTDQGRPPASWLYRIAHNLLVDYWRTHRKTWALGEIGASYTLRFDETEQRAEIRAAVDGLRPAQRDVIVGRFYHRLKIRELTHISTVDGVKKLQDRALVNLRRALEAA